MQTDPKEPVAQSERTIFSRVLVPVDFSPVSHRAVFAALELQRCCRARVCVFYVTHAGANDEFLATLGSPTSRSELRGDGGRAAVRRFVSHIAPGREDDVECDTTIGDDSMSEIRAKIEAWKPSLLVLSHVSHASLLRTHVEKLIRSIELPVLLLHPSASELET